jgi:hypothetical protein
MWAILMLPLFACSGCAERKPDSIPAPSEAPRSSVSKPHAPKVLTKPAPGATEKVPSKPALEGPPPLLVPAIADEHKARLEREVASRIRQTERLVAGVNQRLLTTQQSETFLTIQSFLAKAKEALDQRDVPRALNLAEKAQALAEDLPSDRIK